MRRPRCLPIQVAATLLVALCGCTAGHWVRGGSCSRRPRARSAYAPPSAFIATHAPSYPIDHRNALTFGPRNQANRRFQPIMGLVSRQSNGTRRCTQFSYQCHCPSRPLCSTSQSHAQESPGSGSSLNAVATSSSMTFSSSVVGSPEVLLTTPPDAWVTTTSGSGNGGRGKDDDGGHGGGGEEGGAGGGEDGKQMAGPVTMEWVAGLTLLWEQYVEVLERHPLRTKAITAALIAFVGDLVAQVFEEALGLRHGEPAHMTDLVRSWAVFLEGLLVTGPGLHFLYGALEKWVPSQISLWNSVVHVLADELLFDPLFVLGFFVICGVLEGKRVQEEIVPQIKDEYWAALKGGWLVSLLFLPLEFATFRCLPVQYRVLVVNLTDVAWTAVVSYFTHLQRNRLDRRIGEGEGVPALQLAH